MKKITTNNKQQTTILIVILMLGGIMLSNLRSIAQTPPGNYTKKYANVNGNNFLYTDNVVTENFIPTNTYNFNGIIIFQPLENSNSINDFVIHLLNESGTIVATKYYRLNVNINAEHMIPIAAAYNSNTQQYIVTGNGRNLNNTQLIDTWYLLLDKDLAYVHLGGLELASTFTGNVATDNSTMVTDVCPVVNSTGKDFAFVGMILKSGINTAPKLSSGAVLERRMFISTLDVSNYSMNTMKYQLTMNNILVDSNYFPARIIEVPTAQYGGLFVTGAGAIHYSYNNIFDDPKGFFYLRTNYSLVPYGFVSVDNPNDIDDFFSGGNLYYDSNSDDILVSGSVLGNSVTGNGFFFDRISDVGTTSAINCFSLDAAGWNGNVGIKRLPSTLVGYPKSGKISTTNSANNYIAGKIFTNTLAKTLPVLLECDYVDIQLINWTTNQNTDIYYYRRAINTINPLQYYDGYNYDEIWYPNHSSTQYPFAAYNTTQFGLSGLDDGNSTDMVVMNFTDNTYNNGCLMGQATLTLDLVTVSSIGTPGVAYQQPSQTVFNPSYQILTLGIPNETDCGNTPFKNGGGSTIENAIENKYVTTQKGNTLSIFCNLLDTHYQVLNIAGGLIQKGNINNDQCIIPTQNLSKGLYFIKILNTSGQCVKTIKFTQN